MDEDITYILKTWKFDPDKQVRVIKAANGREVLQVRQPMGIEQYELDGRPDGLEPSDRESYLDIFEDQLKNHIASQATDRGFSINHEEFLKLQNEGILYYYRYLVLFQIGEFERTERDTRHNLHLCDLIEKYTENEEDKIEILQYRPYILRMYAISKAMVALSKQQKTVARTAIETAIEEIEGLANIDTPAFQFEQIRSLNYLRSTLKHVLDHKGGAVDHLQQEMENAVQEENYERAAELRDQIRHLNRKKEGPQRL